jgi:putative flippase GtrA
VTQNGVNLAIFALTIAAGAGYALAAMLANVSGLALSYVLNRLWTFRAAPPQRIHHQLARYVVTFASAVGLGVAILVLLVETFAVPEVLAQAIAIVIVAPLSYLVQRSWVFRAAY